MGCKFKVSTRYIINFSCNLSNTIQGKYLYNKITVVVKERNH